MINQVLDFCRAHNAPANKEFRISRLDMAAGELAIAPPGDETEWWNYLVELRDQAQKVEQSERLLLNPKFPARLHTNERKQQAGQTTRLVSMLSAAYSQHVFNLAWRFAGEEAARELRAMAEQAGAQRPDWL